MGPELPAEVGASGAPRLRGEGQQPSHVDADVAADPAVVIGAALGAPPKVQNHKASWGGEQSEWKCMLHTHTHTILPNPDYMFVSLA